MNEDCIILLHGWGMNSQVFAPLAAALTGRYAVQRPGLPGYAASPWSASTDFEAQLEHVS